MTSPTAAITFQCYPDGRVVPDLWADGNAKDRGSLNAVNIERLVRLVMRADSRTWAAIGSLLDIVERDERGLYGRAKTEDAP
jgi:hypothetical protein